MFRMINTTNRRCCVRSYKNQLQQIKICKLLEMFRFGHRFVIPFLPFPHTLILYQMFSLCPIISLRCNPNGNCLLRVDFTFRTSRRSRDGKRRIKTRNVLFLDLLWAMDPQIYRLNIITRSRETVNGHIALINVARGRTRRLNSSFNSNSNSNSNIQCVQ